MPSAIKSLLSTFTPNTFQTESYIDWADLRDCPQWFRPKDDSLPAHCGRSLNLKEDRSRGPSERSFEIWADDNQRRPSSTASCLSTHIHAWANPRPDWRRCHRFHRQIAQAVPVDSMRLPAPPRIRSRREGPAPVPPGAVLETPSLPRPKCSFAPGHAHQGNATR